MAKKISTRKTTAKSSSTAKKTSVKNAEAEVKASVKEATVEPKTVAKEEAVKPKAAVKKTAKAKTPEKKETVEAKPEAKKEEAVKPKPAAKKKTVKAKTPEKKETVEAKPEAKKEEAVKPKPAAKKKTAKAKTSEKKAAVKAKPVVKKEEAAEPKTEVKEKTVKAKPAAKKAEVEVKEPVKKVEIETKVPAKKVAVKAEAPSKKEVAEPQIAVKQDIPMEQPDLGPRRSVAFIGSECYPFVKTGGLGDVMSALPKALAKLNLDVKVILPRYKCIPQKYQEKMEYRGSFYMDLCADGKQYYVGIMEYQEDGVVYDFIDNDEFFSWGDPYTNLIDDIPKFCYFGKAALAALNYLDWTPDIVHCHDWQAALVPLYLRTCFSDTNVGRAIAVLTIHNLRFQGVYDRKTIQYWSGLPDYVFNKDCMIQNWLDANMLKGGITYSNKVTTVSNTYAWEIQTEEYGEGLEEHLRYHNNKVLGIVNGIDTDIWNPATDKLLASKYDAESAIKNKKANKKALQESLGLDVDDNKMVIGLISRLTNQKGLDLVNDVIPGIMDGNTQVVVLGTGDAQYEDTFRYYEDKYKGSFCAYIAYNENVAHNIYAGCDALLVPSRFEPCGLTQLISMRYGAVPIVRETGGLKDTVQPYNAFENTGNGFTFDRYESGLLYDAINRAKTLYFENRVYWDDMVVRDMNKDVSWEQSAKQYKDMYVELTPRY
ncbi:glycogen/starch synthase [Anaerobutyricum hallii]|uniref:glycogen synthase n=1 Tax=Anaerobutyricum hallii TaxID=39488 RepID=UPI00399CCD4A